MKAGDLLPSLWTLESEWGHIAFQGGCLSHEARVSALVSTDADYYPKLSAAENGLYYLYLHSNQISRLVTSSFCIYSTCHYPHQIQELSGRELSCCRDYFRDPGTTRLIAPSALLAAFVFSS